MSDPNQENAGKPKAEIQVRFSVIGNRILIMERQEGDSQTFKENSLWIKRFWRQCSEEAGTDER